jgi:signal transduction histidine kinase
MSVVSAGYVWISFITTIIVSSLAVSAWRSRPTNGAAPFALMMLAVTQLILGQMLVFMTAAAVAKNFWLNYSSIFEFIYAGAWLIMTLQLSGVKPRIRQGLTGGLVFLLLIYCCLMSANYQGWFFKSTDLHWPRLPERSGGLFAAYYGVVYTLCLGGIVMLGREYWRQFGWRRRQIGTMLLGFIFGVVMSILRVSGTAVNLKMLYELFPLVETFSALIIAGGIFGFYFFDIMVLAQATVTRNMGDGLLVVDNYGHIVEANPSALAILRLADRDFIDNRLQEVCRLWTCREEVTADRKPKTEEWVLSNGSQPRYFLINVIPLFNWWKSMLGKALVLHDITLQKQLQAQMIEDQKALLILQERQRLRREIHDGTGQIWSYVNLQIEAARSLVARNDLKQADQMLEKTADIIRSVHGQVRESIAGLQVTSETHPDFIKQVAEYLRWYSQNWEIKTELVIVDNPADDLFSPHVQLQLLRIIQEALTNARKHAQANLVQVRFRLYNQMAEIVIDDDGCGFVLQQKTAKSSYGLKIMEERAAEVGCRLLIKTALHAGTRVIIEIPFPEEGAGHDESVDC